MIEYCEYCGCDTEHTIDQTDEVNDKGRSMCTYPVLNVVLVIELNADEKL